MEQGTRQVFRRTLTDQEHETGVGGRGGAGVQSDLMTTMTAREAELQDKG